MIKNSFFKLITLGFIAIVFLSGPMVRAQDGSLPPPDQGTGVASDPTVEPAPPEPAPDDPVVIDPGTTESTAAEPAPADPRSVPSSDPQVTPKPEPSMIESPLPMNKSAPEPAVVFDPSQIMPLSAAGAEPKGFGTMVFFVAAAVLAIIAAGGYAAYKVQTKKKSQRRDSQDAEEDENNCLDLKQRLEKKLEELTDVRARMQGKVQDMARQAVTAAARKTRAGGLVAQAEKIEKEYHRLQRLYQECLAGSLKRKRVFIVHNWGGKPTDGWYPWLAEELKKIGFRVFVLEMPDTERPDIAAWVLQLERSVGKPDAKTFLVGHSIGCQTIMRYLGDLPDSERVGGAVFVAGWLELSNLETDEEKAIARPWLTEPIDFEKVKKHAKKFLALFSDNDTFVPASNHVLFQQRLDATITMVKDQGHFTQADGVKEISPVLKWLSE